MSFEVESIETGHQSRRYNLEERKAYITQWKQSQLTRSEFCRREGLCLKEFCYWVKKYTNEAQIKAKSHSTFIPLKIKNSQEIQGGLIEIYLPNGLRCCFKQMTDIQTLFNLVKGLWHVTDH